MVLRGLPAGGGNAKQRADHAAEVAALNRAQPPQPTGDVGELVERLRKMARCVYLAAEGSVANDLSDGLTKAADALIAADSRLAASDMIAWIDFAENGNIRLWTSDPARAETEKAAGRHLRGFTLSELIALVSKLPQCPSDDTCSYYPFFTLVWNWLVKRGYGDIRNDNSLSPDDAEEMLAEHEQAIIEERNKAEARALDAEGSVGRLEVALAKCAAATMPGEARRIARAALSPTEPAGRGEDGR